MKPKNADLIRLADVQAMIMELTGQTRSRATIYNWATKGRRGGDEQRIKLKTTRRLGVYYTTRKWVLEFIGGI